tara:strand:+ start:372 stop:1532 length:1161 start_codon:yes stop_codon:yes gene_type:complete
MTPTTALTRHTSLSETLSQIGSVTSLNHAHPNLLNELAKIACLGFDQTLNQVIPLIQDVTLNGLLRMHPDTLYHVASMVSEQRSSRIPLDMLSGILHQLSSDDLGLMHPMTLQAISRAATLGSTSALNAIATRGLPNLSQSQFNVMGGHKTLNLIIKAGQLGSTYAINALTHIIETLRCSDLTANPNFLYHAATIARRGHIAPLNALTTAVDSDNGFTANMLSNMSAQTLGAIADAASSGHNIMLDHMSLVLKKLSPRQFFHMDSGTLKSLSHAACNHHPIALNSVAPLLEFMTFENISDLESGTFKAVSRAADLGHTDGLLYLGHAFSRTTEEQKCYLDPEQSFFSAYCLICQADTPPLSRHSSFSRFSSSDDDSPQISSRKRYH